MKRMKKSPIKESLLHTPGESLNAQIQQILESGLAYIAIMAGLIYVTVMLWWFWITKRPPNPISITVITILVVGFLSLRLVVMRKNLVRLRMARDGEIAVGQFLEGLYNVGAQVFHDIPGEKFNIDHLVISPRGIYLIETKTYSKPEKGKVEITSDGENLFANGNLIERNPFVQARALTKWVQDLIKESTGKSFTIRPVVLFPGWFVKNQNMPKDIWVLNPKAFPKFLQNERDQIPMEDVYLISYHLKRYIRTATSQSKS